MSITLTPNALALDVAKGIYYAGPAKVFDASEEDLSTPNVALVFDTRGVSLMSVQLIFANYTGVTVKAQRSLDGGTTWSDIASATTSTSGVVFSFDPQAPLTRLSIAGTLSGSADTLGCWVYQEYMR